MVPLAKHGGVALLFCLLFLVGCKPKLTLEQNRLQPKEAQLLYQNLASKTPTESWINAKADASVNIQGKSNSFNINLRSKSDSLLWASINPALGIEVARALLLNDSIWLINKLAKEYYAGNMSYVEESFNVQNVSLQLIQQLIFGEALLLDADEKYRAEIENGQYILKNTPSRRLRRRLGILRNTNLAMDVDSVESLPDEIDDRVIKAIKKENDRYIKRYYLNEKLQLVRQSITDVESKHVLDVQYSDFTDVEGKTYPFKVHLIASGLNEKITFDLSFNRLRFEDHQSTPFKIPSSYTEMQR